MNRPRFLYIVLLLLTVLLGLASRRFPAYMPPWVELYMGDVLWALMVFLLLGLFFPKKSTGTLAAVALLFSLGIELSQFYHAPWIDELRAYRLGGLVLGFGFRWSDLVCYTIGVGLGLVFERLRFGK